LLKEFEKRRNFVALKQFPTHTHAFGVLYLIQVLWIKLKFFLGLPTFLHDLNFMLNRKLGIYYKFCWGILIPGALLFFFGYYLIFAFPELGYAGVPFPKIAICKYER
jgi:hypothetical protein